MYKSISIENFRCFENTKIEGFEQINLIGGQNNAGKTALLEALYLGANPTSRGVFNNEMYHRKKIQTIIEGNDVWKDLFFGFDSKKIVNINAITSRGTATTEIFSKVEEIKEIFIKDIKDNIEKNRKINTFTNNLVIEFTNFDNIKSKCELKLDFVKNSFGFDDDDYKNNNKNFLNSLYFFYSNIIFEEEKIASQFDNAKLIGYYKKILAFCNVVDSQIIEIDTFENEILVKKINENFIPLRLWGDALNKVLGYLLEILNGKYRIILIDEIENGIHHSNQRKLWKMLFDLAKEFDVQVFATSHSAEMIAAFQDVAMNNENICKAKYFELTKNQDTNKIIANSLNINMLQYEILKKQPFRGE